MKDSTTNRKTDAPHHSSKGKPFFKSVLIFFFWIGIWQAVYWVVARELYVPSPYAVLLRLQELVFEPVFWQTVTASMGRVLIGLLLSVGAGVITGLAAGLNRHVYDLLNPMVTAIKATPVMSFIILTLIWFSSSQVPIFICFLMCYPIIWTNVVEGIKAIDPKLLEMAKIYQVKPLSLLKNIYLPSLRPYFFAACLTSFGMGWKVNVAAEVLSNPRYSIGSNLYTAKAYLDSVGLFAWTFVVIMLSVLLEKLFAHFVRNLRKGGSS